ncbi:unnamed protein product, partial [Pylaiella littoralis]
VFVWYPGHHRWYPNGTTSDLTVGDHSPYKGLRGGPAGAVRRSAVG